MSTYTYNTFLNQYTDTDSNLQIIDTDGVIKFTINPYSILTTMISNNLLTFKIKSGRLISIPFSTMNESKIALILAEERIQLLINKTPNFIDKQVEKYVEVNWSSGVTGATGATGATGPAVSGEPLTIPMIDLTGSGLTNSIITISGGGQTAQTIIDGGGLYVRGGVSTFNNGIYSNRMMVREGSSEEMNIINNERSININSVDKVVVTAGDDTKIELNSLVYMKVYTVGELPSVVVGTAYATVIDADSPVYMTPIVGGGSVTCPVFYNGVEWLAH